MNKVVRNIIPRFERTCSVKIIRGPNNEIIITCDCNMMIKWGMACRRIYAIIKRLPNVRDAKVRWLIGYAYYYGRNDIMTKHLVKMRECEMIGVTLTECELKTIDEYFAVGQQNTPLEYFTRAKTC